MFWFDAGRLAVDGTGHVVGGVRAGGSEVGSSVGVSGVGRLVRIPGIPVAHGGGDGWMVMVDEGATDDAGDVPEGTSVRCGMCRCAQNENKCKTYWSWTGLNHLCPFNISNEPFGRAVHTVQLTNWSLMISVEKCYI